jgi:hypothetical protein
MYAEWSVEIGPDAPALEVPWRSEDGSVRYFDLKKQPELLLEIPETLEHFEIGDFLSGVNAKSEMTTAKCDVWLTDEMTVEDEIFGERMKRCSYVDIFFDREIERFDFAAHERLADLIVTKFGRLPEMPASLEIMIRQCHFHRTNQPEESDAGYCFTFYVTGYGHDEVNAHVHWAIALNLLRYAILQFVHTPGRADKHPDE